MMTLNCNCVYLFYKILNIKLDLDHDGNFPYKNLKGFRTILIFKYKKIRYCKSFDN